MLGGMAGGDGQIAAGVPGLRDLREARGWSQARLVHALESEGARFGVRVASRPSLKVAVSRWENRHQAPDATYRRLLCSIFGVDETALGLPRLDDRSGSAAAGLSPRTIGPEVVAYFDAVLRQYVLADALLGPCHVTGVAVEQATQLQAVCRDAQEPYRRQLLSLASEYAEFIGWLSQDSGDTARAVDWTVRAHDLALFVGDPQRVAYTAMRRSSVALDAGDVETAAGFASLSANPGTDVPPRVTALAWRQRAHVSAATSDERGCRAANEAAIEDVARAVAPGPDMAAYCTPAYVQMEAGASLARLGDHAHAIDHYRSAVALWDDGQRRDKGLCLARLADTHAAAGDVDEACATAIEAIDVTAASPSARAAAALRSTRNRLHRHRRDPRVSELHARLAAVV
jgi:transcriptional regulator with XRE-family HTH domain